MLNLPNEVKLDIFKCLNFNQIFSFKQTNGYFCSLIDKYIGILAKKEFYSLETIVYKSVNDKKKYLQLNEDVKQEFGFGDFQLNSQLEEKWQLAVDKKTPMYLYSYSVMKEEPFIINFAIRLTKSDCWFNQEWIEIGDEIPSNYLLLKLPYIPKNIEEMLVWRFWLHRLFFDFSFEIFIFNNIVFNPTMLMLLFEDKNIIDNIKIDVRFGRNLLDLIMYHYKKYKESHNISLDDNSVSFPYANLKLERVW